MEQWGGVKAQDYVTTKDNATDPTKQDVTYTFNNPKSYSSDGVKIGSSKVATVYNGNNFSTLYPCTTQGLDRLAFGSGNGTGSAYGKWWWRTNKYFGIQLRDGNKGTTRYDGLGILNLKKGDVINIKGAKIDNTHYTFPGASSVGGTAQTPNKEEGEASYSVTYGNNSITIEVTEDGYVSSWVASDNNGYINSITITETKPNVVKPEGNITKVDGTRRVISLTSQTEGASIYYTTDGSEPTVDSKLLYNTAEGITIDNTTTIKAIAVSGEDKSEVYSETFEAGTEVSLATPTFEITNLTEDNGVFKPTYTIAIDNSNVLCSPEATFSAQFNGEDVANFDGTFNVDTKGNLVVTASANGYTSTSISIKVNNYIYSSKKVYFDNISESNLTERLGEGWTVSEESTRWASWNQTKGFDKDLNKTKGQYYTATHSGAFTVDFANFQDGTELLFGYGLGSSRGNRTATIPNAPKGSVAKYNVCGWGNIELSKFVDYNNSSDLSYTIERYKYTLRSIELYLPATETVSVSAVGYATYATTNNVRVQSDVEVMTVKVNEDKSTITLNKVEAGTVIPANTGILVKAAQGDYNFVVTSDAGEELPNNNLVAAKDAVTSDGAKYFALTTLNDGKVGFAKVAKDVVIPAGKAYLMVEKGTPAKFFGLDGEATGINSVKTAKADGAYYTLEGVKTTKPVKGLYIHNGKKIVVK